ncbi:MAG: NAD(P)-dependent oxidoreductase [bacterium]
MKVGFIGLGNLGSAMAKRLIDQGVELLLWNRTKSKALALNQKVADNPKTLAEESDIIFLNLFDSDVVEELLFGINGIFSAKGSNKIIVDTTTNHPFKVLKFHQEAVSRGAIYLEAPVLGSVVPASQGALTILVSGDNGGYQKALIYLQKLGKTIFYLKDAGLATKMKLINNMLLGVFMASISEALVLAENIGMKKESALEVFASGAGNSIVLNAKREKLIKEDFSPHFSSAAIYKDLHYLQDLSYDLKHPLFLGNLTKELFALSYKNNLEAMDFSAIYSILKKI